jgi:hypothetical protein
MPSDPIARWESEGGSILSIECLRLRSRPGANNPQHMTDGGVASPPEPTEAPPSGHCNTAAGSTEQPSNPHRESRDSSASRS